MRTDRLEALSHGVMAIQVGPADARRMSRRFLVGPIGYALATLSALIIPWLAVAIFLFLNVFFLWPRKESLADSSSARER